VQTVKAMALGAPYFIAAGKGSRTFVTASFELTLSGMGGALGQIIQKLSTLSILWSVLSSSWTANDGGAAQIAFQMLSGVSFPDIARRATLEDSSKWGLSVERLGDLIIRKLKPALNPSKMSLPAIGGGGASGERSSATSRWTRDLRNLSSRSRPVRRSASSGERLRQKHPRQAPATTLRA